MTPKRTAGILSSVMILAVVILGAIDGLVWMPLAIAPGYSLSEIHDAMEARGEGALSVPMMVVWAVFWGLAAVIPVALVSIQRPELGRMSARTVWAIGLMIGSAAIFFQWWAAFSMGMSVSDTLPFPGRQSDFWTWYAIAGFGMFMTAIAFLVVRKRQAEPHPAGDS